MIDNYCVDKIDKFCFFTITFIFELQKLGKPYRNIIALFILSETIALNQWAHTVFFRLKGALIYKTHPKLFNTIF